jgi:hypothetical protein
MRQCQNTKSIVVSSNFMYARSFTEMASRMSIVLTNKVLGSIVRDRRGKGIVVRMAQIYIAAKERNQPAI